MERAQRHGNVLTLVGPALVLHRADNAPEAMLSLVTNTAVPSGLKPAVAQDQRTSSFPYVVPA